MFLKSLVSGSLSFMIFGILWLRIILAASQSAKETEVWYSPQRCLKYAFPESGNKLPEIS
jgi:biotin transporter BioY